MTPRHWRAIAHALMIVALTAIAGPAVGAPPFGPGSLIGAAFGYFTWLHVIERPRRPRMPRPSLDVSDARRESHRAGSPFPEADGTLSWPPETPAARDQRVHDELHARRRAAELAGPDGAWHWPGCRCAPTVLADGRVVISQPDFRCRPLPLR